VTQTYALVPRDHSANSGRSYPLVMIAAGDGRLEVSHRLPPPGPGVQERLMQVLRAPDGEHPVVLGRLDQDGVRLADHFVCHPARIVAVVLRAVGWRRRLLAARGSYRPWRIRRLAALPGRTLLPASGRFIGHGNLRRSGKSVTDMLITTRVLVNPEEAAAVVTQFLLPRDLRPVDLPYPAQLRNKGLGASAGWHGSCITTFATEPYSASTWSGFGCRVWWWRDRIRIVANGEDDLEAIGQHAAAVYSSRNVSANPSSCRICLSSAVS
jgi:hypothetical protein